MRRWSSELERIVLDPALLRIDLAVVKAADALELAGRLEPVGLAAGGSLIDGEDGGHGSVLDELDVDGLRRAGRRQPVSRGS